MIPPSLRTQSPRNLGTDDVDDELRDIKREIVESRGEWVYDEGCLSIPGLYVEMLRPDEVLMRGLDLDGTP